MAGQAVWPNRREKGRIPPSRQLVWAGCYRFAASSAVEGTPKVSCINGRLAWPLEHIARLLKRSG